ncbi:MAG: hypothetical protein R2752_06835 [Vicinamibacterales bacterium]
MNGPVRWSSSGVALIVALVLGAGVADAQGAGAGSRAQGRAAGQPPAVAVPVVPAPGAPAAQEPGVDQGGQGGQAETPLTAQQVEQEFDNFALGQAQRALNLTDGQFFRFARAYRALQVVRRRAQRQRRAMLGELGPLVRGPGPVQNPAAVETRLSALDQQLVTTAQEVVRAYGAVDRVLNVRQRVRFRQFEQQMEMKKLELLARAQAAGRGGPPRLPR